MRSLPSLQGKRRASAHCPSLAGYPGWSGWSGWLGTAPSAATRQWLPLPVPPARSRPTLAALAAFACLVGLASFTGLARADNPVNCAALPTIQPPQPIQPATGTAAAASPDATLQRLLAAVPDCQKDALFLAALGQQLNSQSRYLEAADHLERALMLEPGLKDAQLSYAIALTGSGDVLSARALLDDLLADPALPDTLRPLILRQKTMLSQAPRVPGPGDWQGRFTLATRVGYDSNLLGSPNLGSLALTLLGQTLVLPLDQSYLARGATYTRADAQLELHRSAADGSRWDLVTGLRNRYSPKIGEAGSRQLDLLLERSHLTPNRSGPAAPGPADAPLTVPQAPTSTPPSTSGSYLNMSGSGLHSRAGTRYQAWGAAGGWAGSWAITGATDCQARVGAEWQNRRYLDNPVLSGRYTGLSAFWSCEQASGLQWLLGAKAGHDDPRDASRAGGKQLQASLRGTAFLPLTYLTRPVPASDTADSALVPASSPPGGFLLDLEQSQQSDATGYSPIIDSGRTRHIMRRAARFEYQRPFSRSVQGVVGLEWVAQTSSLELFRLYSRGIYTGLRVSW